MHTGHLTPLFRDREGVLLRRVGWPRVPRLSLVRARPVLLRGARHLRGEQQDVLHVLGGAVSARQRHRVWVLWSRLLPHFRRRPQRDTRVSALPPVATTKQAKRQSKHECLHTKAHSFLLPAQLTLRGAPLLAARSSCLVRMAIFRSA